MYRPISYDVLKETLRGDPSGEQRLDVRQGGIVHGWRCRNRGLAVSRARPHLRPLQGRSRARSLDGAGKIRERRDAVSAAVGRRAVRRHPTHAAAHPPERDSGSPDRRVLVSGKAVALALFTALLSLTFLVLRQIRCPAPLALALTDLHPATNTGVLAGSAMGGDVLSVLMQVGALVTASVAVRRDRVQWMMAAGVLARYICSKLTGVWATLGVLSWLAVRRDWQRLPLFRHGVRRYYRDHAWNRSIGEPGSFLDDLPDADVRGNGWASVLAQGSQPRDLLCGPRSVGGMDGRTLCPAGRASRRGAVPH